MSLADKKLPKVGREKVGAGTSMGMSRGKQPGALCFV